MDALYGEGCDRCADLRNDAASMTVEFSEDALEKGLQEILSGMDVKHFVQKDIYRETLRQFNKAAAVGLSQAGHPEDLTDAFLEKIRHNNEVFAAFKTHRMQNDIARQMLDAKGHLKSFEQFARDVAPITGKYTKTWLRTEYDTAVTRAHRAADWQHFEKEKAIYPRLRWMPTTSAAPDPLHTTFWSQGLTLAVDDPFWSHHHPGDRWGCKCSLESTVEPENDGPITNGPAYENSKGLSGNPGKSGKLFSEDHPYFPKNCGSCPFNTGIKNILGTLFNLTKDCEHCKACAQMIERSLPKADKSAVPPSAETYKVDPKSKSVFVSPMHGENELEENTRIARFLTAKLHEKVFLLPRIDSNTAEQLILRKKLLPSGVFDKKNPDYMIGGKLFDAKSLMNIKPSDKKRVRRKIQDRIKSALEQADNVVLEISGSIPRKDVHHAVRGYFKQSKGKHTIIIKRKNKCYIYSNEE